MARRWTSDYKNLMTSSRIDSTRICAEVCANNSSIRLISSSSVHAYGIYSGDTEAFTEGDEDRRSGPCYLQDLIDEWEAAAKPAIDTGCSVAILRLGVVFAGQGGALPDTAAPFKFYFGGRHGSGEQIVSWVSLDDVVRAIVFLLRRPEISGPFNIVSPNPCTNKEFTRAIGKALGRPAWLPMPSLMAKMILGQGGYELVLMGARVLPKRLLDEGVQAR